MLSFISNLHFWFLYVAGSALLHSIKGDMLCRLHSISSEICSTFPNSAVISCDGNVILQCTGEDGGIITEYSCNGQKLASLSLNKQILVSIDNIAYCLFLCLICPNSYTIL